MNANVNKSNTGKLLVAVLAMAMIIAGTAIVFSDSTDAAGNVAKVGNEGYPTLAEAVAAAEAGQTIELIANAEVSDELDITGKTINVGTYTINMLDGAKITGSKTGKILADGNVSDPVISGYGVNITVENVSISISSETKGELRPIINWNSFDDAKNLTVSGVTFSADDNSKVDGNFSALSVNNYKMKGTAFVNDCVFNGGMIGFSAGCKIDIETSDVVLYLYGATGEFNLNEQLTIDATSSITKTVIGWAGSPAGAIGTSNLTVNVDKDLNLGEMVAGAGNNANSTVNVNIQANVTAYGGDGIDTLTIEKDKTFTVAEGESYNGDKITGEGNLVSKNATVNSDVDVSGNVTMDGIALGNDLIAIEDDVLPISGNAYLTEDLIIPSGKTLRFVSGSTLEMNGHKITIQGSGVLEVEYGAVIKSNGTANEKICLDRNATIDNQGTIGYGVNSVTVEVLNDSSASYAGKGSVEMQNVSGVVFTVVNSGEQSNSKPLYILAVSGNIYAEDDSQSVHGLTVKDARITGDMVIGQGVTLTTAASNKVYVVNNATLTVDGAVVANGLVMQNGSAVVLNGATTGIITAETGDYAVNDTTPDLVGTTVELKPTNNFNLVGLTLTVDQVNYVDDSTSPATTMVSQRLYLEGAVTGVYTGNDTTVPTLSGAEITVTNPAGGKSYIAADTTLSLGTGIKMVGGGTVVLGQIQYVDNSLAPSGFVGTQYRVDATGDNGAKTTTYYIEPFEAAYGNIANAYLTTINVYGNIDIEIDVDLQAKQKIMINGTVDIAEGSTVIVRSQAAIGQINDVQGVLIKYNGASCNEPTSYVVEKKTNEYTSWSGLGPAIADAQPGDVIDVKKSGTVKNDMTIPAGVTLNIEAGATLTFEKDLTIAETAKLVNEGGINMAGEKSKINVDGELTSVDGTIAFTKAPAAGKADTRAINANGTAVVDLNKITVTGNSLDYSDVINGAAYLNNDAQTVITTVPSAITGVEATDAILKTVTVYGNISDSSDVTLGSGTTLVIDEDATVVLGTVNLTAAEAGNGAKVDVDGELTATISGTAGAVDLDSVKGVDVGVTSYTSADNVKTDYVVIDGILDGAATVVSGKVNAGDLIVDGNENILTVASGATLAVEDIAGAAKTLKVGATGQDLDSAALVVDGTILFDGGALDSMTSGTGSDPATRQIIQINGTMTLADDSEIDVDGTLNIAGDLIVSTTEDAEAVLNVYKYIVVGTEPTALGAGGSVFGQIALQRGAFVLAYAGADVSGMIINPDINGTTAVDTEYHVNDVLYMTAYTSKSNAVDLGNILTVPEFKISGYETKVDGNNGYDITSIGSWKFADGTAATGNVGADPVYIELNASEARVQISVGTGISVYIDGVKYLSGYDPSLTVGTHSIETAVNPGYTGDVQITFNGQTVTGDSFTITPEMAGTTVVLTVTGNISVDNGSGSATSDDGMGLTDYLLIILVVLIVIMAIMVAMRLMRS